MPNWLRDWFERRKAVAEVRRLSRDQEARMLDENNNPLRRAADLVSRNNLADGAAQWELARTLLPNAIVASDEALDILCGLKRYDEADALMRERLKKSTNDRFALAGLARISEERGDLEEALQRWQTFRDRFSHQANGFYGCARCLLALGRLDEAEQEADRSIRRGSEFLDGWVVRGIVSDRRGDWDESLARWKQLTETHKFRPGFARAANAMIQLGRVDEAETYLSEPARLYGGDLEIALMHAQLAERRGDRMAACERWAVLRRGNPYFQTGYLDGVRCLVEAGRHDEADAVMRDAMDRFPDQAWPVRDYARLAHARGDKSEAAIRWISLRSRFPNEDAGFTPDESELKTAGDYAGPDGG